MGRREESVIECIEDGGQPHQTGRIVELNPHGRLAESPGDRELGHDEAGTELFPERGLPGALGRGLPDARSRALFSASSAARTSLGTRIGHRVPSAHLDGSPGEFREDTGGPRVKRGTLAVRRQKRLEEGFDAHHLDGARLHARSLAGGMLRRATHCRLRLARPREHSPVHTSTQPPTTDIAPAPVVPVRAQRTPSGRDSLMLVRTGKFYLFLVLANLFWAGNFLFGSVVVDQLSPVLMTAFRWAAAAPLLIVLAVIVEKPRWRDALREWPMHLLLAGLGLVGFCIFSYEALLYTTPTDAAVVGAINPAIIAVVAGLLARERVGWQRSIGILVSLVGVLVVISGGDPGSLLRADVNAGHLWMLGAVAVWTCYTILGRRLSTGPVTSSAIQATIATLALAPFAIPQLGGVSLDGAAIGGLLYIAVFPSVLSLVLWNVSVKKVGASTAGVYLNLLPIFTALLGVAVGVALGWATVFGGLLVVLGVTITSLRRRPAGPDSATGVALGGDPAARGQLR